MLPSLTVPTHPAAQSADTQVSLSWNVVPGATSYKVYRSLTSGSGYAVVGTPATNSYLDTGLTDGTTYYYVISAVTLGGESARSTQVSATPEALTPIYQIHAGSGTIGAFNPDAFYTGGALYSVTTTVDTSGVVNAAPMAVYQTQRFGNFSYVMPDLTPGASYTVRLHFAETYFSTLGQRYANIAINGTTALSDFDVATAAGAVNKALVEQFTVTADTSGNITITLSAVSNLPIINGVEILTSALVPAPTNLRAGGDNGEVALSWGAVAGATSYKVYRSLLSSLGYTLVGTSTLPFAIDNTVTNDTPYYYFVSAVTAAGETAPSAEASATPSMLTAIYQIHAGTGTIGSFAPDAYYTGGTLYSVTTAVDTSGVVNAAPMAVYQTQRFGDFSYVMPSLTPGDTYLVRLHFAETFFTLPGQRLGNVAINGTTVLADFDIAIAAGAVNKALVEEFAAVADGSGNITIAFTTVTNFPAINAVEILKSVPSVGTTRFLYDPNGSLLSATTPDGSVTTYLWDAANRLQSVAMPSGYMATQIYRWDDLRVNQVSSSGLETWTWDGQNVLAWSGPSNPPGGGITTSTSLMVQGPNLVRAVGVDTDGSPLDRQFHLDHQGSVQALTTSSQSIEADYETDAWGNEQTANTSTNRSVYLGGLGYWQEPSLGLNYVRARWMDPITGRWISVDSVPTEPRYLYAANSPTLRVDPTGRNRER
jgi:RHS repeat-associated protein